LGATAEVRLGRRLLEVKKNSTNHSTEFSITKFLRERPRFFGAGMNSADAEGILALDDCK